MKYNSLFGQQPIKSKRQLRREAERQQKREARKQARREFKAQEQERKTKELNEALNAEELNRDLKHASSVLKGSEKIANYLTPIVMNLYGSNHIIQPEEGNDYYKVSKNYNGDPNELFRYITFFKLPEDNAIQNYTELIEQDPHATPQQYKEFKKQWAKKIYKTNTKNLSLSQTEELEFIMNTSAAWHIAERSAYDSEQALERWNTLYDYVQSAYATGDTKLFDKVISWIENEKSLNSIINKIDDELFKLLKK